MAENSEGKSPEDDITAVKEPPTKKCRVHEEPHIVYCFDCDNLICRHCTAKVHKDHNFEFSKIAAPDTKKNPLEKLGSLIQVTDNLSSAIEDIQTNKQEVEAEGDSVTNTIQTSFNELQQILEKRKNELLHEASMKVQEKIDKLSEQEKNLSLANVEVQSIILHSERFLIKQAEIRSRIQREVEEHGKSGRSMEPVEEADMDVTVVCTEAQLCQTNASSTQLALDSPQYTVKGVGVETTRVYQTETLTTNILTNSKTTRCSAVVVGQLKSLYDGSLIKCNVDQSRPGEYRIQYKPTVRGRHELSVSVDGQQIAGSPFPVFVSVHGTQLGSPVKVWSGLRDVESITTNSVGDVIVSYNGDIVKLESKGTTSVLVKGSDTKLSSLGGVSTDDEDNIFCADFGSNKVMKCSKNGGNVQVYEVKQVKGLGYWGVAVIGDEVMLCECGNKGTIMVYDRELRYVRFIKRFCQGEFIGVSADDHGNLYVTDSTNNCIRVFSNNGVFLRSFGCDEYEETRLDTPYRVCVSGDYVYVTNEEGRDVILFTTAGEYLSTFVEDSTFHTSGDIVISSRYPSVGEFFDYPCDVCADKDGFVYVVDSGKKNVQCF